MKKLLIVLIGIVSSLSQGGSLESLIQNARFQRPAPQRLVEARSRFAKALREVDQSLGSASEFREGWERFLQTPALKAELNAAVPNKEVLEQVYLKMFLDHKGLEHSHFLQLRSALREFSDASYFHHTADLESLFEEKKAELAELVARYEVSHKSEDRLKLGETLTWMERGRLSPALVAVLLERYTKPTSVMQVSGRVLKGPFQTPVDQTAPVREWIQGNLTRGTGTLKGTTYLRLIPNKDRAEIEVGMQGVQVSDTHASKTQASTTVTVYSHTENQVRVFKRILLGSITGGGVSQSPADAILTPIPGRSTTRISSRASGFVFKNRKGLFGNLRESIGREKAMDVIPAARAEGLWKAANKIEAGADSQKAPEEMVDMAEQFGSLYEEFYHLPQLRQGTFASESRTSTDADYLYNHHLRRAYNELGAYNSPPAYAAEGVDLGVRVHEAELTNAVNLPWGGDTLSDTDIKTMLTSVRGYVPPSWRIGTHAPRWKFTLPPNHPMAFDCDDNRVRIRLRVTKVEIAAHPRTKTEAQTFTIPFEVHVEYRPEATTSGPKGNREGEVSLVPLGEVDSADWDKLLSFVQPKFSALFDEEIYFDGLTPIKGGNFEPLTRFEMVEFRAEDGWLLFGWHYTADPKDLFRILEGGDKPTLTGGK